MVSCDLNAVKIPLKLLCLLQVLTPDQRALCIVRGYPYFPDAQALANWIAALNGNQDANNLMTAHSSPSSTSFHSNS